MPDQAIRAREFGGFLRRAGAVLALLLVVGGLSSQASPASVFIEVRDLRFRPPRVVIEVGSTVTWTNYDAVTHSTTSDSAVWSGDLAPSGGTFSYTFGEAKLYRYHCRYHSYMGGEVQVVTQLGTPSPVPTSSPLPTPTATPNPMTPSPTPSPNQSTAPSPTGSALPTPQPTGNPATPGGGSPPAPGSCIYRDASLLRILGLYIADDGVWRESNAYPGLQRTAFACRGAIAPADTRLIPPDR